MQRGSSAGSPRVSRVRWPRIPQVRRCPWLLQARHSQEIDAAVCGFPKHACGKPAWSACGKPASRRWLQPRFRGSSPHFTARSAVFMSCCAHRNILTNLVMSSLVHGDSSGAGGSSDCGREGHSQPPVSLSLKWKRLLRDPVRAPDSLSCPEEASASKLAEGFLFLWAVLFLFV